MAHIIDGKKIAAEVVAELRARVESLKRKGMTPGLATVLVGDNPASHVYVGQKIKRCQELGMASFHRPLPADASQQQVMETVDALNADPAVHAILVQLPLPAHLNSERIIERILPHKDADGLHPYNQGVMGRLKDWAEISESGVPLPCTPAGVIELLLRHKIPVSGRHAVVLGRSTLVGKPVASMLLSLNATVTIAHSKTQDLAAVCRSADVLVAAIGRPAFVSGDMIKQGAAVIDVGINRTDEGLVGDVSYTQAEPKSGWITPVPGGVGPMTVAMLMKNTVAAAERG